MQKTKFRQTEMGEIPEDWKIINLEQASELLTDGSHFSPKEDLNGDCFIATVKDMGDYKFNLTTCKRVNKTVFDILAKSNCKPEKGDVLFSKDGTMGLCFVYSQDISLVLLSSIAIIRPTTEFDSYFLKYYLSNPKIIDLIISGYSSGSALPRLTLTNLKDIPILKPSITEQQAIAKILSDLDYQIETLQQQNVTLEAIGKALFKHWFIDFDFPNEKGKPYKMDGGKMISSTFGNIPERWEVKTLEDICKKITDGSHFSPKENSNGNRLIASVKNMDDYDFNLKTCKKISSEDYQVLIDNGCKPEKDDILFSKDGTMGITHRYFGHQDLVLLSSISIIRPIDNILSNYLYFYLKNERTQHLIFGGYTSGSALPRIVLKNIKLIPVIVTPKEILLKFNKIIDPLLIKIIQNKEQSRLLAKIRSSLLPKLMTGKIRVRVNT